MVDEDFRRKAVGQAQGAAIKFTDIDGIGPATRDKITNVRKDRGGRVQAPRDVADMSADELSDKAGISRDRARKAISGGGGNPGVSKRNTTGSVSAAGITYPVGEFRVEAGDQDTARARNDTFSRSKEAIRQDDQKRAPITTDVERWKNNKSGLDFPGVDTPTQDPKVLPKDLKQKQQPRTTEPDAQSQAAQTRQEPQELPTRSMFAPEPFGAELANRDVSLSPDEALNGTGAVATNALGGNFGNEGEQAPRNEPKRPPQSAMQAQSESDGGNVSPLMSVSDDALDAGVTLTGFVKSQTGPKEYDGNYYSLGGTTQAPLAAAKATGDRTKLSNSTEETLSTAIGYVENEYDGDPEEELEGYSELRNALF